MTTGAASKGDVVLRDANSSLASYNAGTGVITNYSNNYEIKAGYDLEFKSYLLGDIDGDYSSIINSL